MSLIKLPVKTNSTSFNLPFTEWKIVKKDEKFVYLTPTGSFEHVVLRMDIKFSNMILKGQVFSPVGAMIEEKRVKLGWSQRDLAEKSSVSQMTISNIENASCESVNHTSLDKIIDALQISYDEVYRLCLQKE